MRKFRKNTTDRFIISLENGPISLSDKFKENYHWPDGQYMQSMTTEKGVRIIVHGKIAKDGSNTNLHVTFEKEKGFERTDLDDAIAFIRDTRAKAKQVRSPESGFIHDHLDDILIKGKTIEASDDSTPAEKAKETKKKRGFPISLKRTPKKSKHDESLRQVLIERKEKRQRNDLISGINTMLSELENLSKKAPPQYKNKLDKINDDAYKATYNKFNMSVDELADLNRSLAATLTKTVKELRNPADNNDRRSSQSNERRDSTFAHDYSQSDHDSDSFEQVLQEATEHHNTTNEPPMFRRHTLEVKKEEFQERIDKMKVAAEGNEKLLDKINKYEQFLEKSGILNKPESTSIISAELTKLEKQVQQALSIKGKQAPAPPSK